MATPPKKPRKPKPPSVKSSRFGSSPKPTPVKKAAVKKDEPDKPKKKIAPIKQITQVRTKNPAQILFILADAADQKKLVEITYKASTGKASRRKIEPYSLKYTGEGLLLNAHCTMRSGVRSFTVKSILDAYMLDVTFEPRATITLPGDLEKVPDRFKR